MKKKNIVRSKRLAKEMHVEKNKQCWRNSILVLITSLGKEWSYHEGFIVMEDPVITIEHGWCESETEIIDVTLPEDNLVYINALSFSYAIAYENILNKWRIPFVQQFGYFQDTRYLKAFQQAQTFCEQYNKENKG